MSVHRSRTCKGIAVGIVTLWMGTLLSGCQSATAPQGPNDAGKTVPHALYAEEWVGPQGGFLSMGDYSLEIPANAVSEWTLIEMEQVSAGDWPVELSPHGIQFNVPVTLRMNAQSEPGVETLAIHWWNPDHQAWEPQESEIDDGVVSAQLAHFSRYSLF